MTVARLEWSMLPEAALIFVLSAVMCLVVGRVAIQMLARAQCIAPLRYADCPPLFAYQATKPQVPTMGGLFVLAVATLVAGLTGGLAHRDGWVIFGAVIALGTIGFFDDYLKFRGGNAVGLRTVPKLLLALGVGAIVGLASVRDLNLSGHGIWLGILGMGGWVVFAMVVLAGCAHAVNLTDGMDGLAVGCVAMAFAVLGLWAMQGDARSLTLVPWCASFAGACVGFLWFNSFPASIVLGDVGALGLGAALGAVSLLTQTAWWLLIVGGIFVLEALSVMLQVASYKWRGGRRIFRVAPIHHHFHLGGIPEPKLIVRFWIVGLMLAMGSLILKALE